MAADATSRLLPPIMSLGLKKSSAEKVSVHTRTPSPPLTLKRNTAEDARPLSETPRKSKRLRSHAEMATSNVYEENQLLEQNGLRLDPVKKENGTLEHERNLLLTLQRHEKYWYEDGSVVLRLDDVYFRLHKTTLCAQSSFFEALLAGPPADHVVPYYTLAVEVLRISDFESLLQMLTNSASVFLGEESKNLEFLGAVARAAYLLRFHTLHAWAVDRLGVLWPSDMQSLGAQSERSVQEAMDALKLSKDANVPNIRKAAYYEFLRRNRFGLNEDNYAMLQYAHLDSLHRAREYCTEFWMEHIVRNPPARSLSCSTLCLLRKPAEMHSKWSYLVKRHALDKHYIDPVASFLAVEKVEIDSQGHVCKACMQAWRDACKARGNTFWSGLNKVLCSAVEV